MPPQDAPRIFLGGNLSLPSGVRGSWALGGQELGPPEISQGGLARYLLEHLFIYQDLGLDSWLGHKQESVNA